MRLLIAGLLVQVQSGEPLVRPRPPVGVFRLPAMTLRSRSSMQFARRTFGSSVGRWFPGMPTGDSADPSDCAVCGQPWTNVDGGSRWLHVEVARHDDLDR